MGASTNRIYSFVRYWYRRLKFAAQPYSFLVTDTAPASDHPLRFGYNLLQRIWKVAMTIDDKIRGEKLQYNIKKEAAKMSALSSSKIDNYEYLAGEKKLPSDQI